MMNVTQWSFVMAGISSIIVFVILFGYTKTGALLALMTIPVTVVWALDTAQYGFLFQAALSAVVYGLALLQLGKESK